MAIFRDEAPRLGVVTYDRQGKPFSGFLTEGMLWNDNTQRGFQIFTNQTATGLSTVLAPNITAVTAANPTVATNLQTLTIAPNYLNALGKVAYVYAAGLYSTAAAQTPTITFQLVLGAVVLASWTSGATIASTTNSPWSLDAVLVSSATGTTGTLEAHGLTNVTLSATATAAETSYNDTNTAASAAIDLTAQQILKLTALMSTGAAGNQVVGRVLLVQFGN